MAEQKPLVLPGELGLTTLVDVTAGKEPEVEYVNQSILVTSDYPTYRPRFPCRTYMLCIDIYLLRSLAISQPRCKFQNKAG